MINQRLWSSTNPHKSEVVYAPHALHIETQNLHTMLYIHTWYLSAFNHHIVTYSSSYNLMSPRHTWVCGKHHPSLESSSLLVQLKPACPRASESTENFPYIVPIITTCRRYIYCMRWYTRRIYMLRSASSRRDHEIQIYGARVMASPINTPCVWQICLDSEDGIDFKTNWLDTRCNAILGSVPAYESRYSESLRHCKYQRVHTYVHTCIHKIEVMNKCSSTYYYLHTIRHRSIRRWARWIVCNYVVAYWIEVYALASVLTVVIHTSSMLWWGDVLADARSHQLRADWWASYLMSKDSPPCLPTFTDSSFPQRAETVLLWRWRTVIIAISASPKLRLWFGRYLNRLSDFL